MKKNDDQQQDQARFIRGTRVKARYRKQELGPYQGNPLIEALPKIYSEDEAAELLTYEPAYDEEQRKLPAHLRLHLIQLSASFVVPLPNLTELEQRFSRMIRSGLVGRNPMTKGYRQRMMREARSMKPREPLMVAPSTAARGFSIVGYSGCGKSTGIDDVLNLYPQVIEHGRYHRRPFTYRQLVWVKLECPQDGLLSGLCKNFFRVVDSLLGTPYYKNYVGRRRQIDELLIDMADVAARHSIGCLVIDEIQNLKDAKGGGAAHMLNFFTWLDNMLGIPVVLIGTPSALPILTGEFRRARRAAGQGDMVWDRLIENEGIWDDFVDALWKYQYTHVSCSLNDELKHTLYEESQGIVDIAVKLYLLAQMRTILAANEEKKGEDEIITSDVIRTVARKSLAFVWPFLEALRNNDQEKLKDIGDLAPIDLETLTRQLRAQIEKEMRPKGTSQTSRSDRAETGPQSTTPSQKAANSHETSDGSVILPQSISSGEVEQDQETNASAQGLIMLGKEARRQKNNAYEVFKLAGYIRTPTEWL